MLSEWQGPLRGSAEVPHLFCPRCSPSWYWGAVLVWELQQEEQLCFDRSPGQSGCCSLCCPFSSGLTATGWKEGQERAWRGWIPSDILFPAEHLCGKKEGNFTVPENQLESVLPLSVAVPLGSGRHPVLQQPALIHLSRAPFTTGC